VSVTESMSVGFREVETGLGRVRGSVREGCVEFKGIPYGEPTGGSNRFLPPKPAQPWTGVRGALQLGSQSPQVNPDFPVWLDPSEEGEDCLVLNVWAPDHASADSALPVMVWLHGGGFVFGSAGAPFYDGGSMASGGDVVMVGVKSPSERIRLHVSRRRRGRAVRAFGQRGSARPGRGVAVGPGQHRRLWWRS
jgi:hypothetical protein